MQSCPRVVTSYAKAALPRGGRAALETPVTVVAGGECEDPATQPRAAELRTSATSALGRYRAGDGHVRGGWRALGRPVADRMSREIFGRLVATMLITVAAPATATGPGAGG